MLKLQEIKSRELKIQKFSKEDPQTPQTVQFSTFSFLPEALFLVGPSTEKSLKEALNELPLA